VGKHLAPESGSKNGVRRVLAGFVLVLGLCAGALAGVVTVQAIMQKRSPQDVIAAYFIEPPQAHFHKDRINILLLGIDYNYDEKDQEFSTNARSDTIMAVSMVFPTAQSPLPRLYVLSVPRDMDVVMPNGHEDKINAAYTAAKDPHVAAKNSEKVVADFLGLPGFDRFVTLRINATKALIDAIGGIDVVPDETMNYDDHWGHLSIHFIGGKKYHMNGDQAVSYSRFRHDECGDPCRIKRQQQVIRITIQKLKSDKFNDLVHINDLLAVIQKNVYTDISNSEALSIANAFKSIDLAQVKTEQVPYVADKDLACCGNVIIADDAAKNALVKRLFLNPVVPVVVPNAAAVAAVAPAQVRVVVLNGSGIRGMGARMADQLKKKGFVVQSVGNADKFGYDSTEIHVHSTTAPLAGERVRSAIPIKTATVLSEAVPQGTKPDSDVTIIVGRDYAVPPQSEASAVK
jgi:LCP family protein required for cell wall assembly